MPNPQAIQEQDNSKTKTKPNKTNDKNILNDEIEAEHDRYNDETRQLSSQQNQITKTLKELPMKKQKAKNSLYTNIATMDPKQKQLPCTNDSGVEINLEDITQELKNKVDIYVPVN